jgi:hypothetical protein
VQADPVRAHNDYLDLLSEYGLVGVATLLVFLAVHIQCGWKNLIGLVPKPIGLSNRTQSNGLALQIGAIASVFAYLVHSIFDFNLHIPANVLLMAFVFGILANPGSARLQRPAGPSGSIVFWRLLPAFIGVVVLIECFLLLPAEYYAEEARKALRHNHPGTTIHFVEHALETEGNNPSLYDYLGQAQLMRGDARTKPDESAWYYRRALTAFQKGHQLAPLDEDFVFQLAYTYDKLGRFREAEWMYYEALQLDPRSIWAKRFYQLHLDRWEGIKPAS